MQSAKQKILGLIAGINIVNGSDFSSLRNKYFNDALNSGKNNILNFLLDIVKIVFGWQYFKVLAANFFTNAIPELEAKVKTGLLSLLKEKYFCSNDALIPDIYIDNGINIGIESIDWLGLLRIDENGNEGSYVYAGDNDLNLILRRAIASQQDWKGLVTINYLAFSNVDGAQQANVFNVKINETYRGQSVIRFLNDFFSKTEIFNRKLLIGGLFDNMFGIFSSKLGIDYLKKRSELNIIYDKYIEQQELMFDDSYYRFSKNDVLKINGQSRQYESGGRLVNVCGPMMQKTQVDEIGFLVENSQDGDAELIEQSFNRYFNNVEQTQQSSASDSVNNDFVFGFFKNILYSILGQLFSPKVLLFIAMYMKIVRGTIGFKSFNDFIANKKQLFSELVRQIALNYFIRYISTKVIEQLGRLALRDKAGRQKEKAENYILQLKSLIGVNF